MAIFTGTHFPGVVIQPLGIDIIEEFVIQRNIIVDVIDGFFGVEASIAYPQGEVRQLFDQFPHRRRY